jgi:alkylation response protein AidB-like acyl-CoA dehydrogenase
LDFTPTEYTKEQEEFAKEVNQWLDENVPEGMEFPRDPVNVTQEQFQKRRELARRAARKGYLNPTHPREYGGGGYTGSQAAVIRRETGKRNITLQPFHSAGSAMGVPAILACGTEEQKKRLLPPILGEGALTWELFTEPEAGSDEANQQTNALRATREDDYYIVNGGKIFVGGIYPPPDFFLLLTRSDLKAPRHENLSMFMTPADLEGVSYVPLDLYVPGPYNTVSGSSTAAADGIKYQVFFDDVKIHKSYLIGDENDGWRVANAALEVEHGGMGAGGGGGGGGEPRERSERSHAGPPFYGSNQTYIVRKFLDECRNNPEIKQRIKDNPELLSSVVNVYIEAEKERLFSLRNAGGMGGRYGGTQSQLFGKKFSITFTNEIAKVLGPYGMTSDEEWAPEGSLFEVAQRGALCLAPLGTPEVLKIVISRAIAIGR